MCSRLDCRRQCDRWFRVYPAAAFHPWVDQGYLPRPFGVSIAILAVMLATPGSFGPIKRGASRIARRIRGSIKERSSWSFAIDPAMRADQGVDRVLVDLSALSEDLGHDIVCGGDRLDQNYRPMP